MQHDVVEQEAVDGTVAAGDKGLGEAFLVETLDAGFAEVARAEELDEGVGAVGEEVDYFVVETFVEVVAVFMMGFADFSFVWMFVY